MPTPSFDTLITRAASPDRPLLGLTVLVVEDSRFASEALRLLCLRSGARIRRADCLYSAHRHLKVYRPAVAIIDLGLPDGSGLDLIAELSRGPQRGPVILAISGENGEENAALAAGADMFLEKPVESLGAFQEAILRHLPAEVRPQGPRIVSGERIAPDPLALREDLAHVASLLDAPGFNLRYLTGFLMGVAHTAHDPQLLKASDGLASKLSLGLDTSAAVAELRHVISSRLDSVATV